MKTLTRRGFLGSVAVLIAGVPLLSPEKQLSPCAESIKKSLSNPQFQFFWTIDLDGTLWELDRALKLRKVKEGFRCLRDGRHGFTSAEIKAAVLEMGGTVV